MARIKAGKEGQAGTLRRREKRRYILVIHNREQPAPEALAAIQRRHAELFGSIASERASLRLTKAYEAGFMVIRCSLEATDGILVSVALADPAMVTLDMSSSMKRLKRRKEEVALLFGLKLNTAEGGNMAGMR